MPLPFTHFCDLLSQLEEHALRRPPWPPARLTELSQQTIRQWFCTYNVSIKSTSVDPVVVLSALLPARRSDRVYGLQAASLSRKLRRCLSLGDGRWPQLDRWREPGQGDLGACVERIQRQAEFAQPLPGAELLLEEVDLALEKIAKGCRFSAPSLKQGASDEGPVDVVQVLASIYHRLQSRDAKWLTRMILKDYATLNLDDDIVLRCLDHRLPHVMRTLDSFNVAIQSLRAGRSQLLAPVEEVTDESSEGRGLGSLKPQIGVMVGRATFLKGRGIKHAVGLCGRRTMSVERKYDGEYCQIHVNLLKGACPIQIFSKTGKDATEDRKGVHEAIKNSLRLGTADCAFSQSCILEGELIAWSDREQKILPFHKIRKHVSRSGSFLGTKVDSRLVCTL